MSSYVGDLFTNHSPGAPTAQLAHRVMFGVETGAPGTAAPGFGFDHILASRGGGPAETGAPAEATISAPAGRPFAEVGEHPAPPGTALSLRRSMVQHRELPPRRVSA